MAKFEVFPRIGAAPLVAIGRNQCHALRFAEKYPGWHSFAKDRPTMRAIEGLRRRGSVVVNDFGQFRIAQKESRRG